MVDKHMKGHPLAGAAAQDIRAQKLFVGLCLAGSCVVLYRVGQEIGPVKWSSVAGALAGLVYAIRQWWKLTIRKS
jgi:hypothetical protein